jgi:sporulation protein YqfD
MLLKLWNYIRGYVIINVEGYFLEKFINICLHRHIAMWNVEKISNRQMLVYINLSDFFKLRPVVKKSKCHVSIYKRCGLPFLIKRYRARKAFIAGAGIFAALLLFLTSFVWSVEVSGNVNVDSRAIAERLSELGAKPGVYKASVNTREIADEMILQMKELSWISIELRGTKLKVEVAERKLPPQIVAKNEPCDIFATKDGIVKSMVVKAGIEVVQPGTTVTTGQLLVTGVVPNKNEKEPPSIVHAIASVKARTWYEKSIEVETEVVERTATQNARYIFYLTFLDKKLKLIPGNVKYDEYEKVVDEKGINLGKDMVLPFKFITEKYTEIQTVKKEIPFDIAGQNAMTKANNQIVEEIPDTADIIKTDSRFVDGLDGKTYAVITVECLEDIGEAKRIGGN